MEGGLTLISPAVLQDGLRRTPLDQYVVWTGQPAVGRASSLRSRAFACIGEVGTPVSLREMVQRAARICGPNGIAPDLVRNAVRQHQHAVPAVLLLVQRRSCGEYVTVLDIPHAGGVGVRLPAGATLIGPDRRLRLPGLLAA